MIDKNVIIEMLLNGMDPSIFIAVMLIALFGMFIKFMIEVSKAIKSDKDTPNHFTWKHFFSPSAIIRWIVNLLLLPFAITHAEQLFGQHIDVMLALYIGLGIDGITTIFIGSGQNIAKKMKM